MAPGELGTGAHGGYSGLTEALVGSHPVEECRGLPAAVDRPTIVALGLVGKAEVAVRQRVQDGIPAGYGECQDALGRAYGLVMHTPVVEIDGEKAQDLSQPTRVIEGRRKGFGLAQVGQDSLKVARWQERRAQREAQIDGLLAPVARLRQLRANRLETARELRRAGSKDAAFLLLWVSIEALLRQIATHEGLPLERMPSSALLKELFSLGILSRDNLEVAQRAFAVRSALVHGFEATGLDQMTEAVADLAQQLLAELDQHAA